MACPINEEKLIDFQSGTLRGKERDALERHLFGCERCLADYFLLKRDFESAHDIDCRPSPFVRKRIEWDFSQFANSLEAGRRWVLANRRKVYVASMLAAAALLLVFLFRGIDASKDDGGRGALRTLEDAVDSGRESPRLINIL